MKTRNLAYPAAYLILEKDGKILVARRCNTGYQDGMYFVPAGHIELAELPTEAVIREAKEEIGIDIDAKDIEQAYVQYRPKHNDTGDRIDFFFKVKKWSGEIVNMEVDKCDDVKWVLPSEIPSNFSYHVKKAIDGMNEGKTYEEIGVEELKREGLYML
ncbi:MAG: NUDIX domain-containing protein [Patescibacteria group bacterium]